MRFLESATVHDENNSGIKSQTSDFEITSSLSFFFWACIAFSRKSHENSKIFQKKMYFWNQTPRCTITRALTRSTRRLPLQTLSRSRPTRYRIQYSSSKTRMLRLKPSEERTSPMKNAFASKKPSFFGALCAHASRNTFRE